MKKLLVLVVLLWATVLHAQITYWWSQMLKKPDAKQSQEYFFVAGTNIYFTYATNRVIINGSGTNASPMPPGAAFWLSDGTNIFWTNTPPSEAWIGDGITKKIQLRTDGTANFTSNLTCKAQIITKDFSASGNIVGGASAVFYGNGAGLTNIPCCTNGAYTGSFTGDGSGLTNLNVQTNWDFTAITNAPWITNWYTQWDYTSITNAPWITNVTLADLPSGVLTNQDTRIWTNLGGGLYVTGAVTKVEAGAANVLIVSNGWVGVLKASGGYPLDVNGAIRGSSDILAGASVSAGTYVGVNSLKVYLNAPVKGTLTVGALNSSVTNIYLGDATGAGGFPLGTTNILLRQTVGTTPTLSVLNTSNTGPANVIVAGNFMATNGVVMQVKPQFTTNFTCTTNLQTYICNGTNQVITLPTGSAINDIVYRFSCTNGWGKFIISNSIAGGTIRDGFSSTFTQIGIGSPSFFTHDGGTNWASAARTRVVFPNAQFSCSTNIPLVLANTAYPVTLNSTDFNSSQGIALLAGTNGLASKMWITNAGQYEFTPSIVFTNGNVSHIVRYWFRSNDTNIPNSCTPTKFSGNDTYVVTVPFLINITQPTAIEIWAESTGTGEQLCSLPASGNFPATPSVIIPVKRISDPWP